MRQRERQLSSFVTPFFPNPVEKGIARIDGFRQSTGKD